MISVVRTSFIPPRFLEDLYANELGDTEAYSYLELRKKIFSYYIFECSQTVVNTKQLFFYWAAAARGSSSLRRADAAQVSSDVGILADDGP